MSPSVKVQLSTEKVRDMYKTMVRIRKYEEEIRALFLQNRIPGTVHQSMGQEAVAVGVCSCLEREDYITSTHRPAGHSIAKGIGLRPMVAEMYGKRTGCCKGKGGAMHISDISVGVPPAIAIVGGGIPIATGIGLSMKMQMKRNVVACFFGDGASNEGAFHEGLNMAAIWDLPVIFVCENNLYGASTHVSKVMRIADISERAAAYCMPGETVDGNDVLAVYEATRRAVERARAGQGPTLLECKTYRLCGHSRNDVCAYRPDEEEAEWAARDPIVLFAKHLIDTKTLDENELSAIREEVEQEVADAVRFGEESPEPLPEDALADVFYEGAE